MVGMDVAPLNATVDRTPQAGQSRQLSRIQVALCAVAAIFALVLLFTLEGLTPFVLALIGASGAIFMGAVVAGAWRLTELREGSAAPGRAAKSQWSRFWGEMTEDVEGQVVGANDAYRTIMGVESGLPVPSLDQAFESDQDGGDAIRRLRANARSGIVSSEILRVSSALEGAPVRWLNVTTGPSGEVDGAVTWGLADVTGAQQKLGGLEPDYRLLADLVDHFPVGICLLAENGQFQFVNRMLAEWLDHSPQDLVGEGAKFDDFVLSGLSVESGGAASDADGDSAEIRLKGRRGNEFPVHISQTMAYDAEGGVVGLRSIVRDISGEQELEETLRRAEEGFRRFFDYAPVGIVMVDSDGLIVETNAAFQSMVGINPNVERMPTLSKLIVESDRDKLQAEFDHLRAGETPLVPLEVRLDGPAMKIVQMYARKTGDVVALESDLIVYIVDTTVQKNLEAQFTQSQKMQAVGQLAGGIAHDFNNLLTAIIGYSDLLLQRHSVADQSFGDIMQIKQNANRAANLVRQLLAFSRRQTLQPKVLVLSDVLAELSNLLRRLLGENIELKLVLGRDVGLVKVDQGQFEQVIINLAVNARDAMPEGGTLTIKTRHSVVGPDTHTGQESLPPGDYVLVEVIDEGIGIPDEFLDKIFEPFFTTKEVGAGVGLGLSTVYGILKQTGGAVVPASEPGKGTTFRIYVPCHVREESDSVPAASVERSYPHDLTGKGTILIVEDEAPVRLFAARALENKGYSVVQAESAEVALDFLENSDQKIDIAITDVVMPNMDGPTLIKRAHPLRPDMKVIFISGYAEEAFGQNLDPNIPFSFLPKPFNLKELAAKVKEVLSS